jgi:hypothetical protein
MTGLEKVLVYQNLAVSGTCLPTYLPRYLTHQAKEPLKEWTTLASHVQETKWEESTKVARTLTRL